MSKQAVGEFVDDLERLGYVERVPDPADRRAKLIRLTELGWEGHEAGQRIFADIERRWAERFGRKRVATMREVLEQIVVDAEVQAVIEAVPGVAPPTGE
jgi:DNA-binding MarR family transcriptional regulator